MFVSVGYTMDKMYFSTLPSPVDVDSEIVLTDGMSLVDASTRDCSMNYTAGQCFSTFLLARNPTQAFRSLTEPRALIRESSDVFIYLFLFEAWKPSTMPRP